MLTTILMALAPLVNLVVLGLIILFVLWSSESTHIKNFLKVWAGVLFLSGWILLVTNQGVRPINTPDIPQQTQETPIQIGIPELEDNTRVQEAPVDTGTPFFDDAVRNTP